MGKHNDSLPLTEPSPSLNPFKSKESPLPPEPEEESKKHFSFPSSLPFVHPKTPDPDSISRHQHNAPPKKSTRPIRPGAGTLNRTDSVNTRYMDMLLHFQDIPRKYNILASFFTWILLAGFIIFPGTFTSIQGGKFDDDAESRGEVAKRILEGVKNVPLLAIAASACGVGATGMVGLWARWRGNYVFLINRVFLPGSLNSLAGLISTLINVYTQQDKIWSTTAKVTAIVTGSCMVVCAGLLLLYNMWYLEKVRKQHFAEWGSRAGPAAGEEESKVGGLGKI